MQGFVSGYRVYATCYVNVMWNLDRWARSVPISNGYGNWIGGHVPSQWLPYVVWLHASVYGNYTFCPAMFYNHSELVALCDIVCLKPMNLSNIMFTFLSIIFMWAF